MELLLFDKATFPDPLLFKNPYFLKAFLHFRKSYFFRRCCLLEQLFSTANLIFTVTLFIYYLVINPGVFRFKFRGVYRVVHDSENHSIKYHEKFYIKFAFQDTIEQDYLFKHVKIQLLGCQ